MSLGDILQDLTDTQSLYMFRDLYLFTLPILLMLVFFVVFIIESAINKKKQQRIRFLVG